MIDFVISDWQDEPSKPGAQLHVYSGNNADDGQVTVKHDAACANNDFPVLVDVAWHCIRQLESQMETPSSRVKSRQL